LNDPPSSGPRAALRHQAFALYWYAGLASRLAGQMISVAVAWMIYDRTESALALGLIGLAQFTPNLLLALLAGVAADRFNRRSIIPFCQVIAGACAVVLLLEALLTGVETWPIYLTIAAFSSVRTFEWPAYRALLPALVPHEDLRSAVALGATATQAAIVVGPALGGVIYLAGAAVVFGVSAALLVLAIVLNLALRAMALALADHQSTEGSVLAGFHFILRNKPILGAVSLDLLAVLLGGAVALLPIFARDILQVGPIGLGVLRSAPAIGALAMSLLLAWYPIRRHAGLAMFGGVAVFGAATIVFGLSTSFPLSLAALAVMGGGDQVSVFVRLTLTTLHVPDTLRGRVGAANSLFVGSSNQLGEFESGVTAAWWGVVPATVVGGVGTLVVAAVWMALFPALRRLQDVLPERRPGT
jgi:MFS family permease